MIEGICHSRGEAQFRRGSSLVLTVTDALILGQVIIAKCQFGCAKEARARTQEFILPQENACLIIVILVPIFDRSAFVSQPQIETKYKIVPNSQANGWIDIKHVFLVLGRRART